MSTGRTHQVGNFVFSSPHIARGAFSRVYKGHDTATGRPVAVKHVKLQKCPRKRIDTEIAIMRRLGTHPNIVQLLGVFEDAARHAIFLVLEWCDGGDLAGVLCRFLRAPHHGLPELGMDKTHVVPIPVSAVANKPAFSTVSHERTVREYMIQLRAASMHLEAHHVLHRDFKPNNVMLHHDPVTGRTLLKLCDFGLATYYGSKEAEADDGDDDDAPLPPTSDMFGTMCGSPLYISPEMVLGKGYTTQSDLWSIGVMLYELLVGVSPFAHNHNQMQHFQKLSQLRGSIDLPLSRAHEPFGVACRDLSRGLLTVEPTERSTWAAFFHHAWFEEGEGEDENENNGHAANIITQESCLASVIDEEPLFQFDDDDEFLSIASGSTSPQVMDELVTQQRVRAERHVTHDFQISTSPGTPYIIYNYAARPLSMQTIPLTIPTMNAARSGSDSVSASTSASSLTSTVTRTSFRNSSDSPTSLPPHSHSHSHFALQHARDATRYHAFVSSA
jgi:serine/threonine protein kinase